MKHCLDFQSRFCNFPVSYSLSHRLFGSADFCLLAILLNYWLLISNLVSFWSKSILHVWVYLIKFDLWICCVYFKIKCTVVWGKFFHKYKPVWVSLLCCEDLFIPNSFPYTLLTVSEARLLRFPRELQVYVLPRLAPLFWYGYEVCTHTGLLWLLNWLTFIIMKYLPMLVIFPVRKSTVNAIILWLSCDSYLHGIIFLYVFISSILCLCI